MSTKEEMKEVPSASSAAVEPKCTDRNLQDDQRELFECFICHLKESYDYYGKKPNFCRNIVFLEESYIMKDPFSTRQGNNCNFLLLGSKCALCYKAVCQDCSVFYTKRLCSMCVSEKINLLPQELVKKLEKRTT